jgi:hypothetical protein
MPSQPITPNASTSVDRLALGAQSVRGTQANSYYGAGGPLCGCFEAEASAVIFGCFGSSCFEAE